MIDLKDLQGPRAKPFFAEKIMAQALARKNEKQLFFWRFTAYLSMAFGLVLAVFLYNIKPQLQLDYAKAPINKSMVLQLDEIPQNEKIAYVSLEIDEDMIFVVEDENLKNKKEITLAIAKVGEGRKRLPFVFMSKVAGKKIVKLKYLDADFNLVKEDQHNLEFVENNKEKNI